MRLTAAFKDFIQPEQYAGLLLILCTAVSLALANSPAGEAYAALWQVTAGPLSIEHWINDALMAVFFLFIGLELKRELFVGELSSLRNALLPLFAAVGGMAAPALIHYSFNAGTATQAGFGIPMATDIAFTLGVLALLGKRIPNALKVLVVAFAVIDDLGAIVLIATVYTSEISPTWIGLALGAWGLLFALNRFGVRALAIYLLGGAVLWYCLVQAGIHASIAGVMLAFAIPFAEGAAGVPSPSAALEHWLHRPVGYLILPLFALANTAVLIDRESLGLLQGANSLGISLGLLLGKPLGITLLCGLAVALRVCTLPAGVTWLHVVGAGLLGGIGFTMSIFITNLAFVGEPAIIDASKLSILVASFAAGLLGLLWLRLVPARS